MAIYRLVPQADVKKALVLEGESVTIGRSPDCALAIVDERASRQHCVVEPTSTGWTVRDLGSRNGTKVNEQSVSEHQLRAGDQIRVGSHVFVFEIEGPVKAGGGGKGMGLESKKTGEERRKASELFHVGRGLDSGPSILTSDNVIRDSPTVGWIAPIVELLESLPPKSMIEQVTLVDSTGKPSEVFSGTGDGPNALRLLLQLASKARATDIHLETKVEATNVRMRVDGDMVAVSELPKKIGELVFGVVKSACNMHVAGRDAVQDGHFTSVFLDRRVEYRVSFTPSVHGQKLVIRVLDLRGAPATLRELGLVGYMEDRLRQVCDQDHGMILSCGPTGSGKTTTLYAAIRQIDRASRNVVTIEDPVEYQLDNVTQMPIDERTGNTFGTLLRSVLRQDPDVILVGEIRDEETARTAMQASMTGHLVYSSVHAKETITAVFRLLDLRVEPYLVANSLNLVLAQRLVRVLCEHCKRPMPVSPGTATRLGRFLQGKTTTFASTGCVRCLRTGYRGRRALFELLDFNDELRDIVLRTPSIQAMKKIIEQGLFTTLQQFGWRMVADGVTSLDEVDRVAGV